jgi:hypothetical protein
MSRPAAAHILERLAAPLHPTKPPKYVAGAPSGHPDGWYWTPAGSSKPQYLGRNVLFAEQRLLDLYEPTIVPISDAA